MSNPALRAQIAMIWVAWERRYPWYAIPIPHFIADHRLFQGIMWLPVEVAVFVPKWDEYLKGD